jgi:trypsin-like peptidase
MSTLKSATIHTYSLATIRFFAKREEISKPGTGFILRRENEFFLVTALHMLTGRHWQTRKPLSDSGFLPESFSLMLPYYKFTPPNLHGFRWVNYNIAPMSVDQGASEGVAPWYVHPRYREDVDVGVIALRDLPQRLLELEKASGNADPSSGIYAFDSANAPQLKTAIGDDVFVVGFPENIRTAGEFPIWKRGSVASEPDLPIDGLPYILVDTGTRSGMSGSPVVRRQPAGISIYGESSGLSLLREPITELFGVYSGRFGADDTTSQLGIVWKRDVISEIIATPTLGKSSLCTWLWER